MKTNPADPDEQRPADAGRAADRATPEAIKPRDRRSLDARRQPAGHESAPQNPAERSHIGLQLIVSVALAAMVLVWLLLAPFRSHSDDDSDEKSLAPAEVVKVIGPRMIAITPDTPLAKKLDVATVARVEVDVPVLNVTGSIVARLHPGPGPAQDRWQFSSSDVLSAYTDWQKSQSDVEFNKKEVAKVKELDEATVTAQKKVVDRLRKLVAVGTDSEKDLAVEETTLLQDQITGAKSIHEAETALRQAERAQAALARQLQQAGVDPDLLATAADGASVVVADVPEGKIGRVYVNQGCTATFFGFPDKIFAGKVSNIAPVVAKDSRTLRVMFVLQDPEGLLKPGLFAEIGLGADPRKILTAPADGVLHVGSYDYVLRRNAEGNWEATEVRVGELQGQNIEILSGLKEGDRVVGAGAILLKPYVIRAVQTTAATAGSAAAPPHG